MDEIQLPPARRQNLPVSVTKMLKRYILLKRMAPGDRFPAERKLAEALNVSRTVLRESLSQLIAEGILVRTPRTLQVAEFDRSRLAAEFLPIDIDDPEVRDLMELRAIVEIGAIEAIVLRATEEHLREIEHWVIECEEKLAANESIAWADARFHSALLHCLDNRSVDALVPVLEDLRRHVLFVTPHLLVSAGSPMNHRAVVDHRQIYEAIRRRDVETARRVTLSHVSQYVRGDREYVWSETGSLRPRRDDETPAAG